MKLKTLGGKPADFTFTVKITELDGTEVEIDFTGVGRTTLDWQPIHLARLEKDANTLIEQEEKLEAEKASAEEGAEADTEAKPKKRKRITIPHKEIAKSTEDGLKAAVEMIREVAIGWALDDDFSDENIKSLVVRYPGVQSAAWQEYDRRIKGNRAKN